MIKSKTGWQAAMSLSCLLYATSVEAGHYVVDWQLSEFNNRRDTGSAVVVDGNDLPYVAGASGNVYGTGPSLGGQVALVAKYNQAGQRSWLTNAYPTENLDHVLGMELDSSGNVFIAGETYRYPGAEAFLVKYSGSGSVLWERHLGTSDNEFGRDVAVDQFGNSYLLGSTTGLLAGSVNNGYDAFIAKYSPTGALLMLRQYPQGNATISDIPSAIALDGLDMVVVGTSGATASTLTRLAPNGDVIWSVHPNLATSAGQVTQLYDVTVDAAGNIYTCGFTDSVYNNAYGFQGSDAVVAKHNAAGDLIWQRRLTTAGFDSFNAVKVDAFGDVYVAGSYTDATSIIVGEHDAVWAKFSSSGDLLWQQTYATEHGDYAADIAIDSQRNVYVTGSSSWTVNDYYQGERDAYLVRYRYVVPEPSGLLGGLMAVAWVALRGRVRARAA